MRKKTRKKSRAVLLGTNAWPFIIRYWLENFKIWEHKVDRVYIAVDISKPKWEFFLTYLQKRVMNNKKIVLIPKPQGWPQSYADAYKASSEDLLLIMHDDCWINEPDILDKYFSLADKGKVLTPLWEHYSPKEAVEKWLMKKYPKIFPWILKEKKGDISGTRGFSFILYLIFISRKNMEKTNLDFRGWGYKGMGADTGFKFELDLLDAKVKIVPIPRYELHTEEKGPYLHMGGGGTSLPFLFEKNDFKNIEWLEYIIKMKLDFMDKSLAINDYDDISDYRDMVVEKIKIIRSIL